MKCTILHESRGRLRVHLGLSRMTMQQADLLEVYLPQADCVDAAKVYDRTCDVVIVYRPGCRAEVIDILRRFSWQQTEALVPQIENSSRALNRQYEEQLVFTVVRRYAKKLILPAPLRHFITACKAVKYIFNGLKSLFSGRIEVALLDATAITVSILQGDFETAGSVMFLLKIGEILEEWTHKKSVHDLAHSMSLNIDKVWVHCGDQEILRNVTDVEVGDEIIVRTGNMIPLDGTVVSGEATVNQSSMTGESVPVSKTEGSYAYAGTVVEEGEFIIRVEHSAGSGRYDRIVNMIEDSEKLKSSTEARASHLADHLVPWSLGGTALTYLLTRNVTRAMSILMVDFSCALKLSMPLAVLSAMREASRHSISVKGGKFMEAVSEASTIVFDKTGTLTRSCPSVAEVITFGGRDRDEMLRMAACLEEHYPHSLARAVVDAAAAQNLTHEECHTEIQYVVAHGIASTVDDEKVVIGSGHFVFEDECCVIPDGEQYKLEALPDRYTHLFLAIGGTLAAVICIEDPLRPEAADAIRQLHAAGFKRIVMMTGDNRRTAAAVADMVGVDDFRAEVLPEDKAAFIQREHEAGHKVIMIGDGVNDSPALSEADVGIAISDGAAIAREIADITISADDLYELVTLRRLSDMLMRRINSNYRFIMSFNSVLILLGVLGILPPATSALLHNGSTIAISLRSMTPLLGE